MTFVGRYCRNMIMDVFCYPSQIVIDKNMFMFEEHHGVMERLRRIYSILMTEYWIFWKLNLMGSLL